MTCTRGRLVTGSRDLRTAQPTLYCYAVPFVWISSPERQRTGASPRISDRVRIPPASLDPRVKNYHWPDLDLALAWPTASPPCRALAPFRQAANRSSGLVVAEGMAVARTGSRIGCDQIMTTGWNKAMTTVTRVTLTCDLCGDVEDVTTWTFGLDGKTYEIDLCRKDGRALDRIIARYIAKARKVSTSPGHRPARRHWFLAGESGNQWFRAAGSLGRRDQGERRRFQEGGSGRPAGRCRRDLDAGSRDR
jgi:Lsr2